MPAVTVSSQAPLPLCQLWSPDGAEGVRWGWKNDQTQLAEGWGILGCKNGAGQTDRQGSARGNCCTSALGRLLSCPTPPRQPQVKCHAGFLHQVVLSPLKALFWLGGIKQCQDLEIGRTNIQKITGTALLAVKIVRCMCPIFWQTVTTLNLPPETPDSPEHSIFPDLQTKH